MSASYRWSSRSSLSTGYDSRAFGLGSSGGSSSSSSLYGSGSYGYGRSGGLGSSSSSSSRYGSGLDSLNSSREYRSPRSYLSSLESSSTSTYPTRSSYLSSSSSPRSNLDNVPTRTGYIPSSLISSYDNNEGSSRRKSSLTDSSESTNANSKERKKSVDVKMVKETSDSSFRTKVLERADDANRERTSSRTDRLRSDRGSRRNEKIESETSTQVESGRTSIPSPDTSGTKLRRSTASSGLTEINKSKTEDRLYSERDKYTTPSRYDSRSSSKRYSREAAVPSEEPQKDGHFDRKLANYVQDCDVHISPIGSRNKDISADTICSANFSKDGTADRMGGAWEQPLKSRIAQTSCNALSSSRRSSTSSSRFDKAEGDSVMPGDTSDARRSITDYQREKPLDLYLGNV